MEAAHLTVAITGASGAILGRELLRALEADERVAGDEEGVEERRGHQPTGTPRPGYRGRHPLELGEAA